MLPRDPAATAVANTLYRALAVLRLVILASVLGLYFYGWQHYPHRYLGAAILAALTVWTFGAVAAYQQPAWRRPWLLWVDLGFAVGTILVSPYVKGAGLNSTLPGFWVIGVVLAWAIQWRLAGGGVAAVAVAVSDFSVRQHHDQGNVSNVLLLALGGLVLGFVSDLLQRTAVERDRAERAAAAAAERQRLGRVVHDGVLQVLALVRRRGPELGEDGAELSRLAAEQEVKLRAFVQRDAAMSDPAAPYDLEAALGQLARPNVSVALPGTGVALRAATGVELTAVVAECLSNVRHHVGQDAPAWVLVEDLGDSVVVSVRDTGPGIAPGRLEEAAAQGRLGVASSIRGRIAELGGTATLETSSGGTEWEFVVPRS